MGPKPGCFTCRAKKVKCDEQTPECRRCERLDLRCEWTKSTAKSRIAANSRRKSALPKILPKFDLNSLEFHDDLFELSAAWPTGLASNPLNSHEHVQRHLFPGDEAALPMSECFSSYFSPEDWFHDLALPLDSTNVQEAAVPNDTEVNTTAKIAGTLPWFVA